jgi:hypothetical protein
MFQSTSQRIAFLAVLAALTNGSTSAFTPVPFGVSSPQAGSSSSRLFAGDKGPTKVVKDETASAADFVEVRDLSGRADTVGSDEATKIVEDKTASAADFVEVRGFLDSGNGGSDEATKTVEDKTASAADFVEVRDLSDKTA